MAESAETGLSALDALVAELREDRDRHKRLSEHRLGLIEEERRRTEERFLNDSPLTAREAHAWLEQGVLPDDFADRLRWLLQRYRCGNCDGVQDMNVVMRCWFEDEPSWCPECMSPEGQSLVGGGTDR